MSDILVITAFKGRDSGWQLSLFCLPREAFLHTLATLLIPIQT